jgi:hypothetical protein
MPLINKNKQVTSSMKSSHASLASGFSGISAIEAAILSAEESPAELESNHNLTMYEKDGGRDDDWIIIAGGERGKIVNRSEVSKWTGPQPIDSYLLNDDPDPEVIVKKSNQVVNYVQDFTIR